MLRKKDLQEDSNFWISYADLMAGLLFVFILLIGAIVSKSIILKSNLHEKEDKLTLIENELKSKMGKVNELTQETEHKDSELTKQERVIKQKDKELSFKDSEIKKLNKLLLQTNTQRDQLNGKIIIVQNLLEKSNKSLQKRDKEFKDFENRVLILSNQLTEKENKLQLKEEEMLHVMNALDEKETDYNRIVENLQKQKAKIKSLTGIKIKVIAALKNQLGDKISIDPKNGSLRLSSNILFDKGSAKLKVEAEDKLREDFEDYIGELVTNPAIKPHLDRIIIEGHTDSDGGYLYNLDLSQRRAFAVMHYLLKLDFTQTHNIKPLISASGRAYLDAIRDNGVEDKDASRRIEIRFRLKNEDAMHEIEKVLDAE
jgi:chemotaxis protein MotB